MKRLISYLLFTAALIGFVTTNCVAQDTGLAQMDKILQELDQGHEVAQVDLVAALKAAGQELRDGKVPQKETYRYKLTALWILDKLPDPESYAELIRNVVPQLMPAEDDTSPAAPILKGRCEAVLAKLPAAVAKGGLVPAPSPSIDPCTQTLISWQNFVDYTLPGCAADTACKNECESLCPQAELCGAQSACAQCPVATPTPTAAPMGCTYETDGYGCVHTKKDGQELTTRCPYCKDGQLVAVKPGENCALLDQPQNCVPPLKCVTGTNGIASCKSSLVCKDEGNWINMYELDQSGKETKTSSAPKAKCDEAGRIGYSSCDNSSVTPRIASTLAPCGQYKFCVDPKDGTATCKDSCREEGGWLNYYTSDGNGGEKKYQWLTKLTCQPQSQRKKDKKGKTATVYSLDLIQRNCLGFDRVGCDASNVCALTKEGAVCVPSCREEGDRLLRFDPATGKNTSSPLYSCKGDKRMKLSCSGKEKKAGCARNETCVQKRNEPAMCVPECQCEDVKGPPHMIKLTDEKGRANEEKDHCEGGGLFALADGGRYHHKAKCAVKEGRTGKQCDVSWEKEDCQAEGKMCSPTTAACTLKISCQVDIASGTATVSDNEGRTIKTCTGGQAGSRYSAASCTKEGKSCSDGKQCESREWNVNGKCVKDTLSCDMAGGYTANQAIVRTVHTNEIVKTCAPGSCPATCLGTSDCKKGLSCASGQVCISIAGGRYACTEP